MEYNYTVVLNHRQRIHVLSFYEHMEHMYFFTCNKRLYIFGVTQIIRINRGMIEWIRTA